MYTQSFLLSSVKANFSCSSFSCSSFSCRSFSCRSFSLCSSTNCLIYMVSIAYSCTWSSLHTFSTNISLFIYIYNSLSSFDFLRPLTRLIGPSLTLNKHLRVCRRLAAEAATAMNERDGALIKPSFWNH